MSEETGADATLDNDSPAAPAAINSVDDIPQAIRDKLEAGHKRGLQREIQQLKAQLQGHSQLKEQVTTLTEQLRGRVDISEDSDLEDISTQLSETLSSLQTEKEKAEAAATKQAQRLTDAEKRAEQFLSQYRNEVVSNAVLSNLGDKAVSPQAAETIRSELARFADFSQESLAFKMEVTDENGHTAEELVDAAKAVELIENGGRFGFCFKSQANSGTGGDLNSQGMANNRQAMLEILKDGKKLAEVRKTDPELYEKIATLGR